MSLELITPEIIRAIPDPEDWWACLRLAPEFKDHLATTLKTLAP